jgi:hypothetical protein
MQIKHVPIHLRTAILASSIGNGFQSKNSHIQLHLFKKVLLHSKSPNGSQMSLGYTVVDMKEARQLYDTEFGYFTKQLVNFHYYVIITLHFLL